MKIDVRTNQKLVLMQDGRTAIPRRFRATEVLPGGVLAELEVEVDDWGRPSCRRLQVTAADELVTGATLRKVPVARLLSEAATSAASWYRFKSSTPGGGAKFVPPSGNELLEVHDQFSRVRKPRRGSPLTEKHLRKVANEYRRALEEGGKRNAPTEAVSREMHVSRSTAARWVALARERGFLGPARQGRASA